MELDFTRIENLGAHPFIARLHSPVALTLDELRRFGVQWLLTAQGHKRALRHLPSLELDEDTVAEVLGNLHDEFGGGDPRKSHTLLLHLFLVEVGVVPLAVTPEQACDGVVAFTQKTLRHWSGGADPVVAIGFHAALEHAAGIVHDATAQAVSRAGVSRAGREYFELHSVVEQDHARGANASTSRIMSYDLGAVAGLQQGIDAAADAVVQLLDGLHDAVFTVSAA